jgi:hypothetical protein
MTSPASFQGPLPGRRDRAPAVVALLIVAFIALAIAKPWGASPPVVASPLAVLPSVPGAPTSTPGTPPPTLAPGGSFTLPAPPADTAAWREISWRRLGPGDPLATVWTVRRSTWGYLAVGSNWSGGSGSTPMWTSPDAIRWTPIPFDTPTTFWPGSVVVGTGAAAHDQVVLTVLDSCGGGVGCGGFRPGVDAWTSTDGRTWAPSHVPDILPGGPGAGPLRVASGAHGLVAAWTEPGTSGGLDTRIATSIDGASWRVLPASVLPAGLVVTDLRGWDGGFVAVGQTRGASPVATALWSPDGHTWRRVADLPPPDGSTGVAVFLVPGAGGVVAVGINPDTASTERWWLTTDGRHWAPAAGFPPIGPAACRNGCPSAPDGVLAGDGIRILALRGGPDAAAWTSANGVAWQACRMTGDVPPAALGGAVLLPGGVLLSDGTTAWYGAALAG